VLPDIELALRDDATGDLSAPQKTDLFGRYMFPPQNPGTYKLIWKKQNGWDEGEHQDKIVVTRNTQYPVPAEIKPQKGLAVLTGRVRLGDGGSPWYSNEFFGILRFAQVELTDAGGREIAKPVRANFAGDYAVAGQTRSSFRVLARSEAAMTTHVLTPADFLPNASPKPLDLKLNSRRPRLDAVVTQLGGQVVRHADPGRDGQAGRRRQRPGQRPAYTRVENAYDHATIEKTYMVETPASMAAPNVNSVANALFQRCCHLLPPPTHVTHETGRR